MKYKRLLVVYYVLMAGLLVLYWRISQPKPVREASPENFPRKRLLIDDTPTTADTSKPKVRRAAHKNVEDCKRCEEIVAPCSKTLQDWFFAQRQQDHTLHASHGYRTFEDQQESLLNGTSKAAFGWSPHNYFPSRALDVFFIQNGVGSWDVAKFTELASRAPENFTWGGNWVSLKDYPHFEENHWTNLVENFPNGNPLPN